MDTASQPTVGAIAATATAQPDRKLSDIFEEAYRLYTGLDQLQVPCQSPEYQLQLSRCSALLEDATRLVGAVGLFSDNETEDELATEHLKYLLLPYFLGQLVQKRSSGAGTDRTDIVRVADVYFRDFLARCEVYGLHRPSKTVAVASSNAGNSSSQAAGAAADDKMAELTRMAHQRNAKLELYRQKKELDAEIAKIRILIERGEHMDEALRRDFYLKLVRASCIEASDELRSLGQESEMLGMLGDPQRRDQLHSAAGCKHHQHGPSQPLRPVIITKDAFQKAVYGAGYPSLPTMSVDEFYTKRVADGVFPDPAAPRPDPNSVQARAARGEATELDEQEEVAREEAEERDDEMYLARARNMDEFKDEVRRGDGNRHNRS